MRVTKEIDINLIDVDRIPLNRKVVRFTYAIQAMAVFPAIKVAKLSNGRFKILDGRHRWTAHKLLGKETILAKYSDELFKCLPGGDKLKYPIEKTFRVSFNKGQKS